MLHPVLARPVVLGALFRFVPFFVRPKSFTSWIPTSASPSSITILTLGLQTVVGSPWPRTKCQGGEQISQDTLTRTRKARDLRPQDGVRRARLLDRDGHPLQGLHPPHQREAPTRGTVRHPGPRRDPLTGPAAQTRVCQGGGEGLAAKKTSTRPPRISSSSRPRSG